MYKLNNLHTVKINRESVSMGDDINDHSIIIKLRKSYTIKRLIQILESHNFFANVYGNNVAWTLTLNKNEIATYYTKSRKVILINKDYWDENKFNETYYFKYYSPIEKRLNCIKYKKTLLNSNLLKEMKHIIRIK